MISYWHQSLRRSALPGQSQWASWWLNWTSLISTLRRLWVQTPPPVAHLAQRARHRWVRWRVQSHMDILYMLCIPSGSMQIDCRALYCTHSCQSYAAYLFMLDFLKSIFFVLGIERSSELFGQMLSIPTSSNPLWVVTQWPVSTTCQWGYMGFVWASISPPRVCFAVYAWRFWCGCVQCFCWVRMAWQEQAAIVLFMLWRGSCNPVLEKGFSHGGMFHEISHQS